MQFKSTLKQSRKQDTIFSLQVPKALNLDISNTYNMINFFFNLTQGSWPSRSCRWSRRSRTPRSRESGRRSDPSTTGTRRPPPPRRRDPGCSQRRISLRTHRPAQVITKTLLSLLSTLHSSPSPPKKKTKQKLKSTLSDQVRVLGVGTHLGQKNSLEGWALEL